MTDTNEKVFKIRRKSDGLFSTGGVYGIFTKEGKAWSSLNNLRRHLRMVYENTATKRARWGRPGADPHWDVPDPYEGCEVLVFQVTEIMSPSSLEEICNSTTSA